MARDLRLLGLLCMVLYWVSREGGSIGCTGTWQHDILIFNFGCKIFIKSEQPDLIKLRNLFGFPFWWNFKISSSFTNFNGFFNDDVKCVYYIRGWYLISSVVQYFLSVILDFSGPIGRSRLQLLLENVIKHSSKYSGGNQHLHQCKTRNISFKCCSKSKSRDSFGFCSS